MNRRLRVWLVRAAALAALSAGAASGQQLPDGVAECLSRLADRQAEIERGDDGRLAAAPRVGDVCPQTADAIDAGRWGAALAEAGAKDLTARSLEALERLADSYDRPAAAGVDIETASLDGALEELELRTAPETLSLWDRIQAWFDEHFGSQNDEARSRLERWLADLSVPERIIRYVVIALGLLIVAATAVIVWNELRVAGVLARGALRKYAPLVRDSTDVRRRGSELEDVLSAPLASRPALLLALVLNRLRENARAPLRDSLTHRELVRATQRLCAEQSDALQLVVGAAERATFGGWRPDATACDVLIERTRALLAALPSSTADR